MKVAFFGGTGFVGNYIVDELLNASHEPHVLVRPQHVSKLIQSDKCIMYSGDIEIDAVIIDMMKISDSVIYNLSLLNI